MLYKTFSEVIKKIETEKDSKGNPLNMSSIIVSEKKLYRAYYFEPERIVDIRSIAKPIACMAIGSAIEKGLYFDSQKIGLNTPVWQFLSKYVSWSDPNNLEKWKQITLLDCFRITLGHDRGLLFSKDIKGRDENTLVDYIVNYPITTKVGTDFIYSNAGTFIVSSLVTEYLGKDLEELVNELIFTPLGITEFTWKKYGKYTAGCTGLQMRNEDLHKIGKLLLKNGIYEEKEIVPKHWIEKMRTPLVPAPTHRYKTGRAFPKWSYGMNLWITEEGNYYCDGTDGQYLIVIPKKEIIISATGYQSDTEPISNSFGAWK